MELELSLHLREWPQKWPRDNQRIWQSRLSAATEKLMTEQKVLSKKFQDDYDKMIKSQKYEQEQLEHWKQKLSVLTKVGSKAYLQADEMIRAHSKKFTWKDLPQETLIRILSLELRAGVCGQCRYQSGCSECVVWKALRYHLTKEAVKKNKSQFLICKIGQIHTFMFIVCLFVCLFVCLLSFLNLVNQLNNELITSLIKYSFKCRNPDRTRGNLRVALRSQKLDCCLQIQQRQEVKKM